jgi:hypothetical protein
MGAARMSKKTSSAMTILRDLPHNLQEIRKNALESREGEGPSEPETIDGVAVQMRLSYFDRRRSSTDVILDGYHFANEIESTPWSIFKDPRIWYDVWIGLGQEKSEELLDAAGLRVGQDGVTLVPDPYYCGESVRYYWVSVDRLEDVLALWKVWAPLYRLDFEKREAEEE